MASFCISTFRGAALAILLASACSLPSKAQALSDAEIEQAVAMMRATGQSEEQVQQFLNAIRQIEEMEIPASPPRSSQAEDIQAVTGMTDGEMAAVGPIADAIMSQQNAQFEDILQEKITAFEERYADKPDMQVRFDGQIIDMKLIDCNLSDAFSFSFQAPPRRHNKQGPTAGAGQGWDVMNQAWKGGVNIYIDEVNFHGDLPAGALVGNTISYSGLVAPDDAPQDTKPFEFEVTCPETGL